MVKTNILVTICEFEYHLTSTLPLTSIYKSCNSDSPHKFISWNDSRGTNYYKHVHRLLRNAKTQKRPKTEQIPTSSALKSSEALSSPLFLSNPALNRYTPLGIGTQRERTP